MPTAASILDQMNRPGEWDGWVPTFTGGGYRPWADDPGDVVEMDIAHGLAHTFRYGGQSDPAITVAEHCILVADIIEALWPDNIALARAGFLHDAAEAYLHDIQSPLRRCVFVRLPDEELSWNESDHRVTVNVAKTFGVTEAELNAPEVRAADILGACFEKRDCKNLHGDWGLPLIPAEADHLRMRFLTPDKAKTGFLFRMKELGLSR
jgi:hypothetical protein